MGRILELLWAMLPDECEVEDCRRRGVRGNENRVYPFPDLSDFYIVMCDHCNSRYEHGEIMKVDGIASRMIVSRTSNVVDFQRKRKEAKFK